MFNKSWEGDYLFAENNYGEPQCLVCQRRLARATKFCLERHYRTLHKSYESIKYNERTQLILNLKKKNLKRRFAKCKTNGNSESECIKCKASNAHHTCKSFNNCTNSKSPIPDELDERNENNINVEIKEEENIDASWSPTHESDPLNYEIKHENPIEIKSEIDEDTESVLDKLELSMTVENFENNRLSTVQTLESEILENFYIYELETSRISPPLSPITPQVLVDPQSSCQTIQSCQNIPLQKISNEDLTPFASLAKLQSPFNNQETSPAAPTPFGELKVKCLCRLKTFDNNGTTSATDAYELKMFYEKMFKKTCQLSKHQQRAVKTALLSAICEAEEDAEAGKNCEKCCL